MPDRIYEAAEEPCEVVDWPHDPSPFPWTPLMLVHVLRPGRTALTTMGRYQFDGNRPPRFVLDGAAWSCEYADVMIGECAVCHGVVPARGHTPAYDHDDHTA